MIHRVVAGDKIKFVLVSKSTGKTLGTHPTRESALKQERAIQIAKRKRK